MSGATLPEDFTAPLSESLYAAFRSGKWVVDWWEGDPRGWDYGKEDRVSKGYYIRPRAKNDRPGLFCPAWSGSECIFHTGHGCMLLPDRRPATCRLLEPRVEGECILHGAGKHMAAIAWLPFHDLILDIAERAAQ